MDHVLYLDAAMIRAGLITLKGAGTTIESAGITDWVARPWTAGGSAAIVLHAPPNRPDREKVGAFLKQLADDPANGIEEILTEAQIQEMGGVPTAQFWVDLKPGFMISAALQPTLWSTVSARGAHGHAPSHPEVRATFILAGEGISRGQNVGEIDLRRVSPTLAAVMGLTLPTADLPSLPVFERVAPQTP